MTEPVSRAPAAPAADTGKTKAGGKRIFGQRPVVIGVLVAGGVILFVILRGRKKAGAATASATSSAALSSADLAYLQGELNGLAGGGGGGGGTGGPTTATTSSGGGGGGGKRPAVPSGLTTSRVTETTARGSWQKVTGATAYHAQLRHGTQVVHDSTTAATFRAWSGLKKDTEYRWRVRSVGTGGQSAWSQETTFRTKKQSTHVGVPFGAPATSGGR